MAIVGELVINVRGAFAKLDQDFKQATRKIQRQTANLGRNVSRVGEGLSRLTAPIAAVGVVAVKMSTDLNRSLAATSTLLTGTNRQVIQRTNELKKAVQALAVETGKSTTELADGLYNVVSAFGDTADTAKILQNVVKASVAGQSTATESLKLLSSVTKAYGDTSLAAQQKASDLAFATVRLGQTTFPELSAAMGQTASLAKELNISQEELFATFAAGTGALGETSKVATGLRGVMSNLLKPTKDFQELLDRLNISNGQALVAQKGLVGAIGFIKDAAEKANVPLGRYIGSVEGLGVAFGFTGGVADDFRKKFDEVKASAGETDRAFKAVTEGIGKFGFKLDQLVQIGTTSLQKLGDAITDAIGDDVIKLAEEAGRRFSSLIDWFRELSPETQKFIIKTTALTAAFGLLTVAIGGAITAIALLISPVTIVIAAIIALGAAVAYHLPEIERYFEESWATISAIMESMAAQIRLVENLLKGYSFTTANQLAKAEARIARIGLEKRFKEIKKSYEDLGKSAEDTTKKMAVGLEDLKSFGKDVVTGYLKESKRLIGLSENLTDEQKKHWTGLFDSWEKKLGGVTKETKDSFGDIGKSGVKAVDKIKDKLEELDKEYKDFQRSLKEDKLKDALREAVESFSKVDYEITKDALAESIAEGMIEGLEEGTDSPRVRAAIDKIAKAQAQELLNAELRAQTEANNQKIKKNKETAKQLSEDLEKEQIKAHEASVSFWADTMRNAIDGTTQSLEDAFKDLAIGFASEILAATTGVSFEGGFGGLGEALGQAVYAGVVSYTTGTAPGSASQTVGGGGSSGAAQQIGGAAATSGAGAAASGAGAAGSAGAAASAAAGAAGVIVLADLFSTSRQRDEVAESGAQGAVGGALVGASVGGIYGAIIGGIIGAFGGSVHSATGTTSDIDELRRRAVRGSLQETFGDDVLRNLNVGGQNVDFFDVNLSRTRGAELEGTSLGTATGLAAGLGTILTGGQSEKLTDDFRRIVAQITSGMHEIDVYTGEATTSAKNYNDVLFNTNSFMSQLGFNAQEGKDAITQLFLEGEIGLAEFGEGVRSFNELMRDNLVGEGSINDALGILATQLGPEGQPQQALRALQLAFVEASELGENQFEILKQYFADNFGPDAARSFDRLKDLGIQSFEDFNNLSADQIFALFDILFGLTSEFESFFPDRFADAAQEAAREFKEGMQQVTDSLEGVQREARQTSSAIRAIPDGVSNSDRPEAAPLTAHGAIVTTAQRRIVGEAGAEAILPVKKIGGRYGIDASGISSGGGSMFNINVDARGASEGVEQRVASAMLEIRDQITANTLNIVHDFMSRSGGF